MDRSRCRRAAKRRVIPSGRNRREQSRLQQAEFFQHRCQYSCVGTNDVMRPLSMVAASGDEATVRVLVRETPTKAMPALHTPRT